MQHPDPRTLALHAARVLAGKGGEHVLVLELTDEQALVFDYVVIGNGRSERQCHTLVDEVRQFCKRHDIAHLPVEGESGWMLVDCFEVVVHAFLPELRERYRLEGLWPGATVIDHEAELVDLPDPDATVADAS